MGDVESATPGQHELACWRSSLVEDLDPVTGSGTYLGGHQTGWARSNDDDIHAAETS